MTDKDLEKGLQAALETAEFETFLLDVHPTQPVSMKQTATLREDFIISNWQAKCIVVLLISMVLSLLCVLIWLGVTRT